MFKKIKKWFKTWFSQKEPKNWNNFVFTIYFIQRFIGLRTKTINQICEKVDDEGDNHMYMFLYHVRNIPTKNPKLISKELYLNHEFWFDL